jgi:hypothetical protein
VQGKNIKKPKKLALRKAPMYKKQSKQIGMSDFNMPLGMKLDPENRWVLKAKAIERLLSGARVG